MSISVNSKSVWGIATALCITAIAASGDILTHHTALHGIHGRAREIAPNGDVVVNVGAAAGVELGMNGVVVRREPRDVFVAKVRVKNVFAGEAVLERSSGTLAVQVNDHVFLGPPQSADKETDDTSGSISDSHSETDFGDVTITTAPGARVRARDGTGKEVYLGTANRDGMLLCRQIAVGKYTMHVSAEGMEPLDVQFEVRPGAVQDVAANPTPPMSKIKFEGAGGLSIYKDGARIGSENEWIALASGEHTLALERPGFRRAAVQVTLPAGVSVLKDSPNLEPQRGSVAVTATADSYAEATLRGASKRVRIDGGVWERVIALPHVYNDVSCGKHEVELAVDGFYCANARTNQIVEVRDGEMAYLSFPLEPVPARLLISCDTAGARVSIAPGPGNSVSFGRYLDVLALRQLRVTVDAPGHHSESVLVGPLNPGEQRYERVVLRASTVAQPRPYEGKEVTPDTTLRRRVRPH